ncbi:hypothetical protein ACFYO1_28560 [Nocardia sp. NPDC006044]|uniref:hypothetical protein n=1 Tax=Nocardia sp. NPDC006044 TaxID=3364306 RepID=UPI00367D7D79
MARVVVVGEGNAVQRRRGLLHRAVRLPMADSPCGAAICWDVLIMDGSSASGMPSHHLDMWGST